MAKYIVKTPVKNFTGKAWGLAFIGGKSMPFDDEKLYHKLLKKGYIDESKKEKVEKNTDNEADKK